MALQAYAAEVKLKSSGIAMTDEATSTSDDKTYQISASTKRILDLNTSIIVKDDGTATSESYEIDYLNGSVTFDSVDAGRVITITGAYLTPATVATADKFSISITGDALDITPFNSDGDREFEQGLISGTATLSRFHATDDLLIDPILDGETAIIELYLTDTDILRCYGVYTTNGQESPVEALIKETVTFQITTQIGVV